MMSSNHIVTTQIISEALIRVLEPALATRGYTLLREQLEHPADPEQPPFIEIPFRRELAPQTYGHILLSVGVKDHQAITDGIGWTILLTRDRLEQAWMRPVKFGTGEICGYLANPTAGPLPLLHPLPTTRLRRWECASWAQFDQRCWAMVQRLCGPVLTWLAHPESSQYVSVQSTWYIEALRRVLAEGIAPAVALNWVADVHPPHYYVVAETRAQSQLVHELWWCLQRFRADDPWHERYRPLIEAIYDGLQNPALAEREPYRQVRYQALAAIGMDPKALGSMTYPG
jgi:glutathione S-transferase